MIKNGWMLGRILLAATTLIWTSASAAYSLEELTSISDGMGQRLEILIDETGSISWEEIRSGAMNEQFQAPNS